MAWLERLANTMIIIILKYTTVSNQHCCLSCCLVAQSCPTLCNLMDYSPPSHSVMDFPGKNTGVGCNFLLQRVFPTQGSNPPVSCIGGRFFTAKPSGKPPLYIFCIWAKSLQSYLILCDPMEYNPPGFSVPGISQPRILEWVVLPFSRGSFHPRDRTCISSISCSGRGVLYH